MEKTQVNTKEIKETKRTKKVKSQKIANKKPKYKTNTKRNEGITILVLTVTIIILLILAGITIATLTGNNGIINNVSKAKIQTEVKDIQEKIEIAKITKNDGEDYQFESLKDTIGRTDEYNEILSIEDGKLVYDKEKVNDEQAKWLEEMGITEKQNLIPIYTAEQLKKIGTGEEIEIQEVGKKYIFNLDSHYVIQNDINLNCNEQNQWIPLCENQSTSFQGILDGKSHKISGIYIKTTEEENKGLFAYNNGAIQNIILNHGYIEGTFYIAGITARNLEDGKIINCENQVEIYSTGNYNGGIVGYNEGTIENCINNQYLKLKAYAGGICGENLSTGIIKNCKNIHEILLVDFQTGGIVGRNLGTIEKCFNTGNILVDGFGRYSRGGISGSNYGTIRLCYNTAKIDRTQHWNIGGIAGSNDQSGTIEFSYNVGEITERNGLSGGIVGENKGQITNSYSTGNLEIIGTNTGTTTNCLKLTENQIKGIEKITLENSSETNILNLLNQTETAWKEDTEKINNGFPILIDSI